MSYLTVEELNTHLYGEVVAEIERSESETPNLENAIKAAVAEVRSYLTAFDCEAIFNATGDERNPILLLYAKDIAVWHFIQLANPNVEMELRKSRYDTAIKWLDKVQSGKAVPELPYKQADTAGTGNSFLTLGSNPKRNNHF